MKIMKKTFFILFFIFIMLAAMHLHAAKHEIYGYSNFIFFSGKGGEITHQFFSQNRTNLLVSSELANRWDFFLNLEFTGALKLNPYYDHNTGEEKMDVKGSFELEEAWTSYSFSDYFKIKVGIFHASFGTFNVLQDASPSYITVNPPLIYDDRFRNATPVDIIPDKANLELSGRYRKDHLSLEYCFYMGNGVGKGQEYHNMARDMSVGARVKATIREKFSLGVSWYNDNAYIKNTWVGDYREKRNLFSVDFDYSFWKFNVNGEYVWNKNDNELYGKFDRHFFYVNLNAEIVEKLRLYAELNNYVDHSPNMHIRQFLAEGINKAIFGINFKPNWVTAIKAEVQYTYYNEGIRDSFTVFVTGLTVVF